MDITTVIVAAAVVAAIACIGIALVVLNLHKKGEIKEELSELQFANRKYIPPEGYVDTNVVKIGRTRTLMSFYSQGSMSWRDFFDPKSEEQRELRKTVTCMVIGFYVISGLIVVTMAYMDFTLGYYFGLLVIAYATLIIGVNYIKARRG